jgi:hypothetical protein
MNLRTTQARPGRSTRSTLASTEADQRRRAATAKHTAAIATIEALFDRVGELRLAREALTGIAPAEVDADPIRATEAALDTAHRLEDALTSVRQAAAAAEHRSRSDLASDVGTRLSALFPRQNTTTTQRSQATSPAPSVAEAEHGQSDS